MRGDDEDELARQERICNIIKWNNYYEIEYKDILHQGKCIVCCSTSVFKEGLCWRHYILDQTS